MASKSKRRAQQRAQRKEPATFAVLLSMVLAVLAIFQNKYGQFSDIRGFYGLHFADGQHHWPFSTHTLIGAKESIHPVEYPALTGLVMWFFSFFIMPSELGWLHYYWLTASFHVALYGATVFTIKQLAGSKYAMIFAATPAVLYSLNRNWDIWAILPMIIAIILYERGKERSSAILLAISIATKFFPLVLLFPIAISSLRKKELPTFLRYLGTTVIAWVVINAPFALINFRGWTYFYEFNYKRGLGSASAFEITSILGIPLPSNQITFYALNALTFLALGVYLWKSKKVVPLTESAFFTMFAFILWNKQYSMQYIIWLSALAVIAIARLSAKKQVVALYFYIAWQVFDLAYQYSFFQQILTTTYANTSTPASPAISQQTYATVGVIRYALAILFTIVLASFLYKEKSIESAATAP